ncbi:MAG: 3-deoxy-manno-octulosonate cytidylyltransferase, partial [Syntrophobacteraceae bacterium]|nr:3-deoxy-manno-octulosonate cytidylyltransferase [Syntrophobacteraceae bacterium]
DPVPSPERCGFLKHLGYYAYRASFLKTFTSLSPTQLEQTEKLEQLRALEHGYSIRVAISPCQTVGVDTPEDLEKVITMLN